MGQDYSKGCREYLEQWLRGTVFLDARARSSVLDWTMSQQPRWERAQYNQLVDLQLEKSTIDPSLMIPARLLELLNLPEQEWITTVRTHMEHRGIKDGVQNSSEMQSFAMIVGYLGFSLKVMGASEDDPRMRYRFAVTRWLARSNTSLNRSIGIQKVLDQLELQTKIGTLLGEYGAHTWPGSGVANKFIDIETLNELEATGTDPLLVPFIVHWNASKAMLMSLTAGMDLGDHEPNAPLDTAHTNYSNDEWGYDHEFVVRATPQKCATAIERGISRRTLQRFLDQGFSADEALEWIGRGVTDAQGMEAMPQSWASAWDGRD